MWLVAEYTGVCHHLLPDRIAHLVLVKLRLCPLHIMWRTQSLAVHVDQEKNSFVKFQFNEIDGGRQRRHCVDGVREVRAIAEEVLTVDRVLAHEMHKVLSAEILLRVVSVNILKKSLKFGDDCELSCH